MNPVYLDEKFKPVFGKPWNRELSGRMLSLTFTEASSDIRERADQAAQTLNGRRKKPIFEFRNLAYASVTEICSYEKWKLDIYLDTNKQDPAHANFVIFNEIEIPVLDSHASPKNPHEIFRDLAKIIKVVDATDISKVEALLPPRHSGSLEVPNDTPPYAS